MKCFTTYKIAFSLKCSNYIVNFYQRVETTDISKPLIDLILNILWNVVKYFHCHINLVNTYNLSGIVYNNINYYQLNYMTENKNIELVTLREACEMLKVHPQTLRLWDKNGILKAVRFGQRGDRRYRKEDLEKF